MIGVDPSRTFQPLGVAVVTVSDTRDAASDRSGDTLVERLIAAGHRLAARRLVRDDIDTIRATVSALAEAGDVDVVLTTGGTGLTGRDVTPEAIEPLYDKPIPGFGELFRQLSYAKIGTSTLQSRASAGVVSGTYVFLLPGSPSACRDAWDDILALQLDARVRPCNFAELIPRLREGGPHKP